MELGPILFVGGRFGKFRGMFQALDRCLPTESHRPPHTRPGQDAEPPVRSNRANRLEPRHSAPRPEEHLSSLNQGFPADLADAAAGQFSRLDRKILEEIEMKCGRWFALIILTAAMAVGSVASGQSSPSADRKPGFILAVEDTFSFSPDEYDTLLVAAPRVKVEEVIKAIGERMERDENLIKTHEFTTLTTMIQRKDSDPESKNYILYESAVRQRIASGESVQTVQLWSRERKYEDGEMVDEEKKEGEFKTEWNEMGQSISLAAPFSPETGDQYNYEIEDREIVGNNVIYRILFEPKSQFDALPSGTVWVDFSDLVIRRFEARVVGTVPFPLFLKSIPFLRVTPKKLGNFWVADEAHAQIKLRKMPLPNWPSHIELHTVIKDQVINGVAYNDDGTAKETTTEGEAP